MDKLKTKHVNIRVTPDMLDSIDGIQKQMEQELMVELSRSQVMQRLIQMGIEKFFEVEA
jgi:hypothetical protein